MSLASFLRRLQHSRQRVLIWAQGPRQLVRDRLERDLLPLLQGEGLLVSDQSLSSLHPIEARQAQGFLGQTLDYLLFDAFAGFNPNAFGQLCGTLRGGSVLVLMTPEPNEWGEFADPEYRSLCVEPYQPEQIRGHFLKYLVGCLQASAHLIQLTPETLVLPEHWPEPEIEVLPEGPCLTGDQAGAVQAILHTCQRRRHPLVLTADRGRGKSAALGIAAAELLQQGRSVLVTAPDKVAIASLMAQVELAAPEHSPVLRFMRPDEVLRQVPEAEVLLIDEAAAIPVPVLTELLRRYAHVVFATTLHGYEGNGQGFALRFLKRMRETGQGFTELHLKAPVRWQAPDPLEALCNRLLLLDADAPAPNLSGTPVFEHVDRAELAADSERLSAIFGLLVLAHYRTTPGDLRILLDSPNIDVFALSLEGQSVACALVAREGPLAPELTEAVWEGRRRPRGHLLPQTLVAQEGWREAAQWQGWRVVRIAVHPSAQQKGLGQRLLQAIERSAKAEGADYLGASFASEPGLLSFWQQSDYWPVRLGEQRDPVAGSHALLVVKPLSDDVSAWFAEAREWYRQSLLLRLPGQLADLEAVYLPALMRGLGSEPLDASTRERLLGFARANRTLESSLVPLTRLVHTSLPLWHQLELPAADQQLLIQRILRQQAPSAQLQPVGKKPQLERLRQLCEVLLNRLLKNVIEAAEARQNRRKSAV
ncbi:tRNA(Met) cytidine acetyltransferase TmcA [Marinobacterium stanieri]|uniref:tRNA(Met) cytidine acetyltransferase TmcA n=1 Tax=Marinobacterium stanieri TaxID=49186 RepID=UPI000255A5BA|nr:GNAT family N-acetyltransferase [Marinobacterium stanieri]